MNHLHPFSAIVAKMRLSFSLLLLFCAIIYAESFPVEPERNLTTQAVSNETVTDNQTEVFLEALLDYESGIVFYKDDSIPACLVERIPNIVLESPAPELTIPIPSEEVCLGRDNEVFPTDPAFISKPGLLFCNGLPILDINRLTARNDQISEKAKTEKHAEIVRRKRQSNGYYRTSAPVGEARAQSNYNHPGQASQSQVQGQVFGSGFFSGQAQSQNGGLSQSQVQLSGVGIRGQIASSSGNAQAQLALGTGAGSGQASGLGEGPSSSQVQVSLGQQGEESMASASATSGGATAGIGGVPGGGAYGAVHPGQWSGYGGSGGAGNGVRNGGTPYGFVPGTRLFEDTGAGGIRSGGGAGYTNGVQIPGHTGQLGTSHLGYGQGVPSTGIYGGNQPYLGSGGGLGVSDSRFPSGTAGIKNGQSGDSLGHGVGRGSSLGGANIPGFGGEAGISPLGSASLLGTDGQSVPGSTYHQGGRVGVGHGHTFQGGAGGANGQGRLLPDTTQGGGGTGRLQNGVGSLGNQNNLLGGSSHGQPGGGVPGVYHGAGGNGGSVGGNGHYRGATGVPLHGSGGGAGVTGGNGRYGGPSSGSNGASYYTGGGASGTGGGPFAQSGTPGAYAATYGLGQAQAQTVYFGNAGNGQYVPLRYDQASQPGGAPGVNRFQDQQVGVGTAGQRQQLVGNNGVGSPGSGVGSHLGNGGLTNGHRHNLRNGYTSYGYGNGATSPATTGQQPIGSGVGLLPSSNGVHHQATGLRPGVQTHLPVDGTIGGGGGQRTDQAGLGGSGVQPPTYTNGIRRTQGQPQTHLPSTGVLPGSTGYQNGNGHSATTTTASNGQTYTTNGYANGGYGQQTPIPARNGQTHGVTGQNGLSGTHQSAQQPRQTGVPGYASNLHGGSAGQDGFSPSYGISRPSQEDPEGRKCTIVTFTCTIVVESNGRAKICRPNAVTMNGNGSGGGGGSAGSKICCC